VRKPGGTVVEVSLDVGQIVAQDRSIPLCELELELLAGEPETLFDLAQQIARGIAVLPEVKSKSERGYLLAQNQLNSPLRAQPPLLKAKMSPLEAAQCVLREMFSQFTANLNTLRTSDDPEVVHQARVGWRRFKSAWRLCRPLIALETVPTWEPLKTLLTVLGELRDIDVARTETLPQFAQAYTAGNTSREIKWQAMTEVLMQAAHVQRKAVCYALETPAVGATLLAITQWLEELPHRKGEADLRCHHDASLHHWARERIARLHGKLKQALKDTGTPERQHRARILAKRVRYGIEALEPLLNKRRSGPGCAAGSGQGVGRVLAWCRRRRRRWAGTAGLTETSSGLTRLSRSTQCTPSKKHASLFNAIPRILLPKRFPGSCWPWNQRLNFRSQIFTS
jgi:inorganic triphosphatase YgiF